MNARLRQLTAVCAAVAAIFGSASCGDVSRQGKGPAFLVVESLQAASGAAAGEFSGTLSSDVVTLVNATVNGATVRVPTIFSDPGQIVLLLQLKDIGGTTAPSALSPLNSVTLNRYHVSFRRSDGHNVQGVDVPYAFDGAVSVTVADSPEAVGFELVRAQAKSEAPLQALANGGSRAFISTIADVTFYGYDLAGNAVSVTAAISVTFADWGDPS